ncbi:MAG: T9SS type A sorting domain-containing protein, partial [Bacteroidetes bacterium]|nr:T9SS type A sorting domain-containing protein [Bacteroidota bacterium]
IDNSIILVNQEYNGGNGDLSVNISDNMLDLKAGNTSFVLYSSNNPYGGHEFNITGTNMPIKIGSIINDTLQSIRYNFENADTIGLIQNKYNVRDIQFRNGGYIGKYISTDGELTINAGNTLVIDSMYLLAQGQQYYHNFFGNFYFTDTFYVAGNGCFKNYLTGQNGYTYFSMPSGKEVQLDFLTIQDIDASGISRFYGGINSTDNGGNVNIDFSTGTSYTTTLTTNTYCAQGNSYTINVNANPFRRGQRWEDPSTNTILGYADSLNVTPITFPATYNFISSYGTSCEQTDVITLYQNTWAQNASTVFTNAYDSNWYDCQNWDQHQFADSTSRVVIPSGKVAKITTDVVAWARTLEIESGGTLIIEGGSLSIWDSLINNGSIIHTNDSVIFRGTSNSAVVGNDCEFYNLYMNKRLTGSLTIGSTNVSISNKLTLNRGVIYTKSSYPLVILDNATSDSGYIKSYIDGEVGKKGNDAFVFPTGDDGRWSPIGISAPTSTNTQFVAEYFSTGYSDTTTTSGVGHISKVEYWNLDRSGSSDGVKVKLFWTDSAYSKVINTDSNNLIVSHYNGTDWERIAFQQSSSSGNFGWIESKVVTSFSPFTFGSPNNNNPLPITLVDFSGQWQNDSRILNWSTASEINCSHYLLSVSTDGKHFSDIVKVNANQNGINYQNRHYTYNDLSFVGDASVLYYQLLAVDQDGTSSKLPLVKLEKNAKSNQSIVVYPVPFDNHINLNRLGEYMNGKIYVYNSLGQEIANQNVLGASLEMNTIAWMNGIYFVKLIDSNGQEVSVVKIVK